MRKWLPIAGVTLLALMAPAAPAHAQFGGTEATAAREDFVFPAGEVRILVFRPEVRVGSQTTGGMNEPSVEWTEAARAHIAASLAAEAQRRGTRFIVLPEQDGEAGEVLADYSALFRTVANAAFQHRMFPGNRLPTKRDRFDWTLGEGAARLKELGGDYGLFLYTYDSYGSTGRKVIQILGAVAGMGLMPSGVHVGYAGLVDLDTGDLVWLNADLQMGGDVRTAEGAAKRVKQLLEGFPEKSTGQVTIEVPGESAVPEAEESE